MKEFIFKYKLLIFAAIVIIHLAFKSYKLSEAGLWYDEAFSAQLAQRTAEENIKISKFEDPNPPLYGVVLSYWVKIFGDSEADLRSLSVLASALAAGVLFLLCLNFFNWQTSIFASLMYLSSNELYYYSQEARTYSLIILFVLCSYYLYLSIIQRPTLIKAVLFAVANACIFYSHFLACLIIIGEAVLFPFLAFAGSTLTLENENFILKLKTKAKTIIYFILSVIVLCWFLWPWKDRTIFLLFEGGKAMWLAKPTYQEFKTCIYEFFNNKTLYQVHVYTTVAFVVLLFIKRFREENLNWRLIVFALVVGPGLMYLNYFIASYTPIFLKRYILYSFLGFILLYSYLFSMLKFPILPKLGAFIILFVFSCYAIAFPRPAYYDYHKAVPYLKGLQKNGTTLVVNDCQDLFAYYYDKAIFKIQAYDVKRSELLKHHVYTPKTKTWVLDEDFSRYKDIYYTRTLEGYYDAERNTTKMLNEKFKWVEEINGYNALVITHYTNPHFKGN